MDWLAALRRRSARRYRVEVEMGLAALILLTWQTSRIPLEGSVETSVAHARSVLRLEELFSIDVEESVIRLASMPALDGVLEWAYGEIHTPALFAFLAAACLLAPDRYPRLRTIFLLSFVPAVVVIGLYPLAPPHWMAELGLGPAPEPDELVLGAAFFQNSTAAAASQHFGFAVFIAAGSLWLFPRSPLAWATLVYPAIVFLVIVGTGNHYVFDCVVGTLTFGFATAVAALVHRDQQPDAVAVPVPATVARVVLGFAMIAWGVESFESIGLGTWSGLFPDALVLVAGAAAVFAPQLNGEPVPAESPESA